jgi:hypothetical protein
VARALPPQPIEPCPALQRAAVRAVGTSRDESALEALCALAEGCADAALGEELAGALARLGGSRVEGALLSLLACEPAQIKRAAAEALGKVGTIRAVEPMLPLAKGVLSGAAGAAAREAIRSIQERLGDAPAGGCRWWTTSWRGRSASEPSAKGPRTAARADGGRGAGRGYVQRGFGRRWARGPARPPATGAPAAVDAGARSPGKPQ